MYTNLNSETYNAEQVLFTSDLKRSELFYSEILGLTVTNQGGHLSVEISGRALTVLPTADKEMLSDIGVVFQVPNIRKMHRRLCGCCVSFGKLEPSHTGLMQFSVSDPDKNMIFFIEKPH